MKLIRGFNNLKQDYPQGSVVTVGNFDGVHKGHQKLLIEVVKQAKLLKIPSVVVIFEPQPLEFFNPQDKVARLTNLRNKVHYLKQLGIDELICVSFNKVFSQLTAEQFIEKYLVNKLKVKLLILGDDTRFGVSRCGDINLFRKLADKFNYKVKQQQSIYVNDVRVSSSKIREYLAKNQYNEVEQFLGRPYSIIGKVVHGNKLGRTIGFPTANIDLFNIKSPLNGVFIVTVKIKQNSYHGVANIGIRPTINGHKQILEVHILDFNQNLYGKEIEVIFIQRIRGEIKFASFEQLQAQIEQDRAFAIEFFSKK